MAARLNPHNDKEARLKIQTTQLLKRLQGFVLGEKDSKTRKPVKMSRTQVSAALGLLKKTLPDLQSAELEVSGEITKRVVNAEPMSEDEWIRKYGADAGEVEPKPVH